MLAIAVLILLAACRPSGKIPIEDWWIRHFPEQRFSSAQWQEFARGVAEGKLPPDAVTEKLLRAFCNISGSRPCQDFLAKGGDFAQSKLSALAAHPEFRFYVRMAFLGDSRRELVAAMIRSAHNMADSIATTAKANRAAPIDVRLDTKIWILRDGGTNRLTTEYTKTGDKIKITCKGAFVEGGSKKKILDVPDSLILVLLIPASAAIDSGGESLQIAEHHFVGPGILKIVGVRFPELLEAI